MITQHTRNAVKEWDSKTSKTWWAWIYVGGDYHTAEGICRQGCFPCGLCVTIEQIQYVFAGGSETGVRIGLIQYPPFEEDEATLRGKAIRLARMVAEANHQWSYSVVMPGETEFWSRRA